MSINFESNRPSPDNSAVDLNALIESITIIKKARYDVVGSSTVVWTKLFNAQECLEKQVKEALAPDAEVQ